ncbi:hypothetical protein ASD53_17230 [Lysobacter sp. Root559]|nr:hypothetical protein ASD53_17230 [Lysobacter sp. Root559]KRC32196.1 hypothetical protein ASE10_16775 [Lysobacter sp. Root76]KRD67658.1 hypothetical protein ASE45_12950 [Lysobacter sp. Root96]
MLLLCFQSVIPRTLGRSASWLGRNDFSAIPHADFLKVFDFGAKVKGFRPLRMRVTFSCHSPWGRSGVSRDRDLRLPTEVSLWLRLPPSAFRLLLSVGAA